MTLKFPEVRTYCGCISLRTGAKIFGFISLIGGLVLILAEVMGVAVALRFDFLHEEWIVTEAVIDFIIRSAHLVTSFLMLLGVYQEKRKLVWPWLVTTALVAVSDLIGLSGEFLKHFVLQEYQHNMYREVLMILSAADLMHDIYGFIVVYSYYRSLPTQESRAV